MDIKININSCEQCPNRIVSKVYTADSFEDIRKVHCKLLNENVYKYLEWYEKAPVPDHCPAKI